MLPVAAGDSLECSESTGDPTIDGHPTFPHPTIQEALCEIHFRLADGLAWDGSLFGELFKALDPDYPRLEPITEFGVQLQVTPDSMTPGVLPAKQRMRYHHAERNLLVQLAEGVLTVNVLPVYPGWERMRDDILAVWQKAAGVLKPAHVTRLGLRYINRIDRSSPNEKAAAWLRESDHVAPAALTSGTGFLSRVQSVELPSRRTIVTLGETDEPEAQQRSFVLDIDCISDDLMAGASADLGAAIDALHERAWTVFAAVLTPRLERRLRGEGDE